VKKQAKDARDEPTDGWALAAALYSRGRRRLVGAADARNSLMNSHLKASSLLGNHCFNGRPRRTAAEEWARSKQARVELESGTKSHRQHVVVTLVMLASIAGRLAAESSTGFTNGETSVHEGHELPASGRSRRRFFAASDFEDLLTTWRGGQCRPRPPKASGADVSARARASAERPSARRASHDSALADHGSAVRYRRNDDLRAHEGGRMDGVAAASERLNTPDAPAAPPLPTSRSRRGRGRKTLVAS